jgi:hypothetical protein
MVMMTCGGVGVSVAVGGDGDAWNYSAYNLRLSNRLPTATLFQGATLCSIDKLLSSRRFEAAFRTFILANAALDAALEFVAG